MFRGSFGLSRGQQAIKFEERVRRTERRFNSTTCP